MMAFNSSAEPFIVLPTEEHKLTIILLHGRGSCGPEFCDQFIISAASGYRGSEDSAQRTLQERFPNAKLIFPSSPTSQTNIMPQWFNLASLVNPSLEEQRQVAGLKESIEGIHWLLRCEIEVLGDARKVLLFGISMGCATGIHALLSFEQRIAGFIGYLGWCPFESHLKSVASQDQLASFYKSIIDLDGAETVVNDLESPLRTPLLLGYNLDDAVVSPKLSQQLILRIEGLGMLVEVKTYSGMVPAHWIKEPEAMDDIGSFVTRCTSIGNLDADVQKTLADDDGAPNPWNL